MAKAVKRPIIQSDSEDSDNDTQEQVASFMQSSAKRSKISDAQSSGSGSSSDSNSDDEWTIMSKSQTGGPGVKKIAAGGGGAKKGRGGKTMVQRKSAPKKPPPSSSDSSDDADSEDDDIMEGAKVDSSSSDGSSSDSDSSLEQFDDGLDDDLVGDEEDQKKLNLMNEAEREQEVFKRFEKREALRARFEIEQKLRRQKKHDKKKQKEEKQKRLLRSNKRGKQKESSKTLAMDEYKAKRSADKIRKAEAEKHKERKEPLKAAEIFNSESEEEESSSEGSEFTQGDSDDDDDAGTKSIAGLQGSAPQYISTSYELGKIRLSRYRLEKWVHMPFFSEAIMGCFVRIGIGAHEGRMVYRICEIIGVQETPKVYTLGSTKTNKGLRLRHGLQERLFRIEYVSNSQFSDMEFHKWKVEMDKRGLKLPTLDFVRRKARKLEEVKNISLKEEDVEKIIQEKQRFKKNPSNYAMTKSRLLRERETADLEGDTDKVREIGDKLNQLEERADLLDKQRTKGLSAISYINERNRQKNVTRAELALKEELAAGEGKADDPFTRRKCQPTLVTLAVQRDSTGAELIQQITQAQQPKPSSTNTQPPEVGTPQAPNGQDRLSSSLNASQLSATPVPPKQLDDLFSAHNFDIQIDLPSGGTETSTPKILPRSGTTAKQEGPKRSLNLSDYKKRRGLI